MKEQPNQIFDFLPIRKNQIENDYIDHLWSSFSTLISSDNSANSFSIMPFHLLFMLAIQYKILRLTKLHKAALDLFFCGVAGRDKKTLITNNVSVFDFALIKERTIPEIFQIINLSPEKIKMIKRLIDNRNNNLAHAKGGIEINPEKAIEQYLKALQCIQDQFTTLNESIANKWVADLIKDDNFEILNQFFETEILSLNLCPIDFEEIIIAMNKSKKLTIQQKSQITRALNEVNLFNSIYNYKIIFKAFPKNKQKAITKQINNELKKLKKENQYL